MGLCSLKVFVMNMSFFFNYGLWDAEPKARSSAFHVAKDVANNNIGMNFFRYKGQYPW